MLLDKVMTEFMLRIDAAPACIRHVPLHDDDPAKGLICKIVKLEHEMYYSRGKRKYTFECNRDALDLVYQCLDLHVPEAYSKRPVRSEFVNRNEFDEHMRSDPSDDDGCNVQLNDNCQRVCLCLSSEASMDDC